LEKRVKMVSRNRRRSKDYKRLKEKRKAVVQRKMREGNRK